MNKKLAIFSTLLAGALVLWLTQYPNGDASLDDPPESEVLTTGPGESRSGQGDQDSALPEIDALESKPGIRDAVAQSVDFRQAVEAGVFTLSADELWAAVRNHPNREVRMIACPLSACTALADQRSVASKNPIRFGEGKELLSHIRTPERLQYLQWACGRLIDAEPRWRERDHPFVALFEKECGELADKANEVVDNLLDCRNGVCFRLRPDPDGQMAERIQFGLRSSTNLDELQAYTEAALRRGDIIEGIRAAEHRFRTPMKSNLDFLRLLSAKWMCRFEGACGAMSPIVLELCAGFFHCRPGDDLISVAERNLSPLDFEDWMQARLPRQNGGG
jgi:hypothetical protein